MNQKFDTNRSMVKIMLLTAVTFGIYGIITYYKIGRDVNKLVPSQPATSSYVPVALVPTMYIWPIVWMHKLCNKISYGLKERGLNYSFSAREFWLFDVLLAAACGAGPWLFTWRLCKAMNLLCADENARLSGAPRANAQTANAGAFAAGAAGAAAGAAGAAAASATPAGETKPSPVGEGFKAFGQFFLNTFKKPLTAASDFFDNADTATSAVTLGIVGVAYVLVHAFLGLIYGIIDIVHIDVFEGVGEIVGGFFLPILYFAIMSATVFGLYCLINKLFIKKPMNIPKILAFCASCGVGLVLATALTLVRSGFVAIPIPGSYNVFAMVIAIARNIVGLFIILIGLMNLKKVIPDTKNFLFACGIGIAGLYVVNYTISWLFRLWDISFFTIPM